MSLAEQQRVVNMYLDSAESYSPTLEKLDHKAVAAVNSHSKSEAVEVWRSKKFLAVLWREQSGAMRLSVNRTTIQLNGKWEDRITWDELMQVKREMGLGETHAIEIYPADSCVVNVANMRHLWILDEAHPFTWMGRPTE